MEPWPSVIQPAQSWISSRCLPGRARVPNFGVNWVDSKAVNDFPFGEVHPGKMLESIVGVLKMRTALRFDLNQDDFLDAKELQAALQFIEDAVSG